MNVFDRQAKKMQKNRTALAGDYQTYNYLKDEVCTLYTPILYQDTYFMLNFRWATGYLTGCLTLTGNSK